MGLFDQVLSAINNPSQQANPEQMSQILGVVEHLARSRGIEPTMTQSVLSIVGKYVRSALQQQRDTGGTQQTEAIVNQFSGTTANPEAVQALFTPTQQEQIAQDAAQQTGLNLNTIQSMLPALIPLVLNLLQSGSSTSSATQSGSGTSNSVLNTFLDSDADGDVDVGDAFSLASRFLNR